MAWSPSIICDWLRNCTTYIKSQNFHLYSQNYDVKPKIIKSYLKKGIMITMQKNLEKSMIIRTIGLARASITFNQRKTSFSSHELKPFENTVIFLCRQIGADSRGQKEHQIHGKKWWNGSLNAEELSVSSRMLALGKLFEWLISKYIM